MNKGVVLVVLGTAGVVLAAAAVRLLQPARTTSPAVPAKALSGTPALPAVQMVGVASGNTPLSFADTGPVNYTYIPQGWSYTGTRKDW